MTNKHFPLFVLLCLVIANISFASQCDNFYAKITYGLSHTKKALTATNFEHQMYYAERALTALEKSESFMAECGCEKTVEKRLDAMEALNRAIEPVDWDAGRYYSKRSQGLINEIITMLDECTLGTTPDFVVEDSADTTLEHEAYADSQENKASLEQEMITVFEKHAQDKLSNTEKALAQLIALAKSINAQDSNESTDPNSLAFHQKAYLEKAKKILNEGLESLEDRK